MTLIYCVEDDASIRELISYATQSAGYETRGFESGEAFWRAVEERTPELVLLDIMLPGEDGLSILERLRRDGATARVPVIMLTAKTSEVDKVKGLDAGADDYMAKPFGVMELLSRIRAVLRRSTPDERLTAGEITLDLDRREASVAGQAVKLTFKEFELLRYLVQNRGRVLSRERILEKVWGYDYEGETRTVDVHIKTLRQKLGRDDLIVTVRSVGYMIN